MNRETESHFSHLPSINIKRSKFKEPSRHLTTWNTGDLIPIYVSEVLPGDSLKMDMATLFRMQTPIFPVMDNAYMDITFFYCPSRLLWTHWREFWGENRLGAWEQQTEYQIPQIEAPEGGWTKGTIADYLGIPTNVDGISVSHLPFRMYCMVWNEFWRDENLKDPCQITFDETTVTGANSGDYVTYAEAGAKPLKAAKFHDRFTSALPSPQKGPSVNIPLGITAPVIGVEPTNAYGGVGADAGLTGEKIGIVKNSEGIVNVFADNTNTTLMANLKDIGLAADLSKAVGATINQLRQAFAVQAFYEAQSRGGSRYIEVLKNIYGVTSPDARLQRPEYLGGTRIQVNMSQVLQTSGTTETSPQGNVSAFSCTATSDNLFTHSFVEHGFVMGFATVRTDHTYQQGIERFWSRKKTTDFYIPQLANLGEMPVYLRELYAQGTDDDDTVFGYQEAWSEYKFGVNRVSSEMRSNYALSLDAYHYADDYATAPSLSSEWIDEVTTNVDRTIAVSEREADQFFGDFYFDATWVRPMPIYSIPATLNHF